MLILTNWHKLKKYIGNVAFSLYLVDIYSFAHRESEKTCCKLFSHLYSTEKQHEPVDHNTKKLQSEAAQLSEC